MTDVASRELRNNTRALLDRVAAGEDIRITVDGRPVAILIGIDRRPRFMPKAQFVHLFEGHQADSGLRDDLREMLGDETTDDLRW
jgi:prevent-host-death family protein